MAVFDNINKSSDSGVLAAAADFHTKGLLKNMKPLLVHTRDLQMRPLPAHNGRRVQFRRMVPFSASTKPLSEGVTPAGQKLSMTEIWGTIRPYGDFVPLTDEINWAMMDDMQRETNQLLADQAALTLDTLARDAQYAGLNVQYAGGNTSRAAIDATDKLTYDEVKKAVRTLKKNKARKFPDGFYHAYIGPETVYDLTSDSMWTDVATYQDKRKVETGELGCMGGVKFFETTESKTFTAQSYLYGTTADIVASANFDAGNKCMTTAAAITDDIARELVGKLVNVQYTDTSVNYPTPMCIEHIDVAAKKIYFRWVPAASVTANWTTAKTLKIVPTGGGASGATVYSTLIYGQDFAGGVSLDGDGHNVSVIIKPMGSSGAEDPLNQRGTIAWKVKGVVYLILQDAFGVRIEHGATA